MASDIPITHSWELTPADEGLWLLRLYDQDGQELGRVLLAPHLADCLAEGCSHPPPHAKPRPPVVPSEVPLRRGRTTILRGDGGRLENEGGA